MGPAPRLRDRQGPLFVEIRRSGTFPKVPEVKASVVYRIFAGRDYVESGTRIDVLESVGVVSIRNNDMVFDNLTFTHMAFPHEGQPVIRDLKDYPRVSANGDVLRLDDEIPYFALLNPAEKIGVGTIKDMYANVGPDGIPPVLFDNSFYLSNNGREGLMFFFRPLVYFNIGFDRKQLIHGPQGDGLRRTESLPVLRGERRAAAQGGPGPQRRGRRQAEGLGRRDQVAPFPLDRFWRFRAANRGSRMGMRPEPPNHREPVAIGPPSAADASPFCPRGAYRGRLSIATRDDDSSNS